MNKKFAIGPTARFFILIGLFALLWVVAHAYQFDIQKIRFYLHQHPFWLSSAVFILMYVGITSLLWVGTMDIFRISGAIIFGPYWGTLFIWIAEILNAAILFHIARGLGQEFVLQKLGIKTDDLKYSKHKGGFWGALILRMNPLVPFRLMDLGFGLSKIEFKKYLWAVIFGSPLRILGSQFVLASVGEAILNDPKDIFNYMIGYFQEHQTIFLLSAGYVAFVFLISIVGIVKGGKKKTSNVSREA